MDLESQAADKEGWPAAERTTYKAGSVADAWGVATACNCWPKKGGRFRSRAQKPLQQTRNFAKTGDVERRSEELKQRDKHIRHTFDAIGNGRRHG